MSAPLLSVEGLRTHIFMRKGVVKAVDGVSFDIAPGEIVGLAGESGSGKSMTGFSILGLLDPPIRVVEGSIHFKGQDLRAMSQGELRALRGDRISMVFQDPMMTLNPVLKIGVQIIETIRAHYSAPKTEARAMAVEALGKVGIPSPEARMGQYPHELSGGMRQRVAIAIATILSPDLIIADEPTTALDVTVQAQILRDMKRLCEETGAAMILITHDLALLAHYADRIMVMYEGELVETGAADDVLYNPQHPYTVSLLQSLPGETWAAPLAAEGTA